MPHRIKSTSVHLRKLFHLPTSVVCTSWGGHICTMTRWLCRPRSFFHASTPYVFTTGSPDGNQTSVFGSAKLGFPSPLWLATKPQTN
eukprot:19462-Ditylum_brightwellii.AAC.1